MEKLRRLILKNSLSKFEAISIIVIITITQIILNMPEYLVSVTGTGTIINIVYITVIGFIFCLIIYNLLKNFPNLDIIDIAQFLGGNFLKFILSAIFIIFFMLSAIVAVTSFTYLIKSIYFSDYSTLFITLFFIAVIIFANLRRI